MAAARSAATIAPGDLRSILRAGSELALLDVREEGVFLEGHLFLARNLPLERLAAEIEALVPRRRVLVVLMDGGDDGRAQEAALLMAGLGYTNVLILAGGLTAWGAHGGEVFSGSHVPSKAFGEFVELTHGTPHVTAAGLAELIRSGADLKVLDARTAGEFRDMSIPTAVSVPGEDLVRRVRDVAPDRRTMVVVNCAGRTRSIIGAQALINAGCPNPVFALKDGTSGWQLAGLDLDYGRLSHLSEPSAAALNAARLGAARVERRFGIRRLSRRELARWQAEAAVRTLYLVDVRSPGEFATGHMPGARNVPGGLLVQATDRYLGVIGARVALIDDDGVRATFTASWLIQMGWSEVAVVIDGLDGPLEHPASDLVQPMHEAGISPASLAGLMRSSLATIVLDGAAPDVFARGHVPGAYNIHGVPPNDIWQAVANFDAIIVTAEDETKARDLMASLRARTTAVPLKVLAGGTVGWIDSSAPLEAGEGRALPSAARTPAGADGAALEQQLRKYLSWEVGLMDQLRRSGEAPFRYFAP